MHFNVGRKPLVQIPQKQPGFDAASCLSRYEQVLDNLESAGRLERGVRMALRGFELVPELFEWRSLAPGALAEGH